MRQSLKGNSQVEKTVQTCFRLPQSKHVAIKMHALKRGRDLQDLFVEIVEDWMERNAIEPVMVEAK